MSDDPMPASSVEAIKLGHKKGSGLQSRGARPEDEEAQREMWGEAYRTSPFRRYWDLGFRAGYRGQPEPSAGAL